MLSGRCRRPRTPRPARRATPGRRAPRRLWSRPSDQDVTSLAATVISDTFRPAVTGPKWNHEPSVNPDRALLQWTAAMAMSGTIGAVVVESGASAPFVAFARCLVGGLLLAAWSMSRGWLRRREPDPARAVLARWEATSWSPTGCCCSRRTPGRPSR